MATKNYTTITAALKAATADIRALNVKKVSANSLEVDGVDVMDAIESAKQAAIDGAKVTLTQGTGITVTPNGTASNAFTVAVDNTVATTQSVTELAGRVTTAEGEIDDLQTAVENLTTGDNSVASQIAKTALSATSTGSDNVAVVLGGTISAPTLTVTGTDIASAKTLAQVQTTANSAIQTVEVNGTEIAKDGTKVNITAIVGVDETAANGIKAVKTADNKVKVEVTTATYTPAAESVAASWSDETQVVTAGAVKSALADVDAKHTADIEKVETAIESLSTSGFSREIVTELPTTNIKLNAIYLVAKKESDANEYVEYIYVGGTVTDGQVTGGRFEQIGTTKTDLGEYAKTTEVTTAIDNAIKALDSEESGNGITVTQVDGVITAIAAATGTVAEGDINVVTGGVVHTAIKAVSDLVGTTAVVTQISDAIAALDSEKSGNGITVALTDGKVTAVSAAAGTVAEGDTNVVTGGVVHTAVEAVKSIAEAKISAVQNDTTHFGSPLVATSGTTVTVSPAKEWSVGDTKPASTITSVINGKMSNGSTIDDANLTDGTSMFANNTALTTYVGDLGKLTTGTSMFSSCAALTTFVGNLSSLTDGTNMFAGCSLDEESLIYIVDSLPTVASGTITVGVAGGVDKTPYVTEAATKGWTLA